MIFHTPHLRKCSTIIMYVDDTSLAYSAKNDSDISNDMKYELDSLRKWLHSNTLSLNVAKTTSMLIGTNMHYKIKQWRTT